MDSKAVSTVLIHVSYCTIQEVQNHLGVEVCR